MYIYIYVHTCIAIYMYNIDLCIIYIYIHNMYNIYNLSIYCLCVIQDSTIHVMFLPNVSCRAFLSASHRLKTCCRWWRQTTFQSMMQCFTRRSCLVRWENHWTMRGFSSKPRLIIRGYLFGHFEFDKYIYIYINMLMPTVAVAGKLQDTVW